MAGAPPKDATEPRRGTLLYVANTDWYLFNFRLNLLHAAKHRGWTIHFASPQAGYFERLQTAGYKGHAVTLDSAGLNPWRELRTLLALARTFRRVRPDVIHLFTLKCVLYGCLAAPFARHASIVGAVTGMGHLFTTRSWRTRLLKPAVLLALKFALRLSCVQIVFQNTADRDEFIAHGLIPLERTSVIRGSGVDCERFQPSAMPPAAYTKPRLLFCGRLIQEKGIHEYMQATATLRNNGYSFESRIAGAPYPGNPSSLSTAAIEQLKNDGSHIFLGHHDDMAQLFAQTDIVVLPTYREGTPKALLEAAACGCIIVTTDIPGCQGIVDQDKNGALAKPRDAGAIATALEQILDRTPEERHAMREHSRTVAIERFSDREVNRETLDLYKALAHP